MKKLYVLLFSILLIGGLLTGCSNPTEKSDHKELVKTERTGKISFPVKIKDGSGQEVTIKEKPDRIVSVLPSNTEISFALGLGKEIVGVSDYDNYPKEVSKKEKIGGLEINVEKVISLKPQLVLANSTNSKQSLQQLRDAGIPVLVVNDAESFKQVYQSIEMIGKATGEKQEAKEVIQGMKKKLASILGKVKTISDDEQKKVFVEVSPEPEIYTAGKNTFIDEILTMIHAKNAAKKLDGWVKMNDEAVIEMNPDIILTTYGYYTKDPVGKVLSRKGWQEVKAIKNKQVVDVNSDLVTRPGPRLVEGVEALAKTIYPDNFAK
ncbi:ABC transporter substrate-binding protein [Neobacillus sp. PS3-40]|uniref:ABC transporter substrate-binding protein n=1 Tax=Neobacillus sp. PS3-40 TaxID=3070679 RepID=UPI0027E001CA|nr:ABC transporter substrate-binding protein [Neobacillus sp. PS3-40]WML43027.1 ABC transporter substrate-binding protein [Neobacillus sp. PS3-40]